MRRWTAVLLVLAGMLVLGSAPMQCPSNDPDPTETVPEAPEECYLLAQELLAHGDVEGWRTALQYVVERFGDSRWAARARDDLANGPPAPASPPVSSP
jgi:hypothetical protein